MALRDSTVFPNYRHFFKIILSRFYPLFRHLSAFATNSASSNTAHPVDLAGSRGESRSGCGQPRCVSEGTEMAGVNFWICFHFIESCFNLLAN